MEQLRMNWLVFTSISVLTISQFLPPPTALAQDIIYSEDFDDRQAQGWDLEAGWQVRDLNGNQVLSGNGHYWARSNQAFTGDYRLSYRLMLSQGTIHLNDHLNDLGRYFIGFTQDGSTLSLQFWPAEFHENLEHADLSHSLNTWHQIELVSQESVLSLSVDGTQEWSHAIDPKLTNGSFAFETLDASEAYIDDIVVTQGTSQPQAVATAQPAAQQVLGSNFTWVRTGGPIGGLGYDIRMQPDNPDIMYVTDAWAGAHKSTDGGQTWITINDGITGRNGPSGDAVPVFSLTIDPNNSNILWAGLQDLGGLYRSNDAGQSWEKKTRGIIETNGLSLRGISIEPGNSNVVYAAGEISPYVWKGSESIGREFDRTMGVVYKSTDGGENWRSIWRGDNLARYVWIDPTDINTLYVSTGIFDREAANSYWDKGEAGGVGILKSTDGGQTWRQINQGLNNLYIGSLFMHPRNSKILLAGAGNNSYTEGSGIYLTTDGGENWQMTGGMEDRITSVEFSSSDPNIAYAGGETHFLRSEDGGKTWSRPETTRETGWGPAGIRVGFPIDFQVDPRDPDRVFINNYGGGNFLTEDGGKSWISSSTGYTGADLKDISIDPLQPGLVYVNGRSGPFVSRDAGVTWEGINVMNNHQIGDGARIVLDPSDPDHVLVSSGHWGWTYNSSDGGANWELVSDYFDILQSSEYERTGAKFQGFSAITFAPSEPQRLYAGFGNASCLSWVDLELCSTPTILSLLISEDGGQTWQEMKGSALDGLTVSEIVVHPQQAGTAWASTMGGGVFVTTDGGTTWQAASKGLNDEVVMGLAIDPNQPQILYAGTTFQGVYKSEDGGQSWKASRGGMDPNEQISSIVVDPARSNIVYAGSLKSGVFISEDSGKTWRLIKDGLRTRSVRELAISADGMHLYAATRGEGVFRLDLNGQVPASLPGTQSAPTSAAANPTSPAVDQPLQPNIRFPCGSGLLLLILASLGWQRTLQKRSV